MIAVGVPASSYTAKVSVQESYTLVSLLLEERAGEVVVSASA